jgi:hypothetical protein
MTQPKTDEWDNMTHITTMHDGMAQHESMAQQESMTAWRSMK